MELTAAQAKLAHKIIVQAYNTGIAKRYVQSGFRTSLTRYQRFVNWACLKLFGAERGVFEDYNNFDYIDVYWERDAEVEWLLKTLHGTPECRRCGKTETLFPDPAGYYVDAERYDGAPLLCTNHTD